MDPLFNNGIANMYGPSFLIFYALVAAAALLACAAILRSRAAPRPAAQIPADPDPYEIAYLRGGENEVIRTAALSLLQKGLLTELKDSRGKDSRLQMADGKTDLRGLNSIEQAILQTCRSPILPSDLFSQSLPTRIRAMCISYHEDLVERGLLSGAREQADGIKTYWPAGVCVLTLGGYKLIAAINNGHSNVGFLVIEMLIVAAVFGMLAFPGRLTAAGKEYVNSLQVAFSRLKQGTWSPTPRGVDATTLTCAVFGVAALADTPHSAYAAMFQRAQASSGSGCGSSSDCGSSGGGSCGGGGGGCGGCGGG